MEVPYPESAMVTGVSKPHQRRVPPEPVILVHGYLSPKRFLLPLKWRLERRGFDAHLVDLSPLAIRDVRVLAKQLAVSVERVLHRTGAERCILVGVSLGGFVALCYVKEFGGADRVRRLVAMGAPFQGTWFALAGVPVLGAVSRGVWQSLPTSSLLSDLRAGGSPVPVTSMVIPGDVVAPPHRCTLEGAEVVTLDRTWFPAVHQWLVISGKITERLADLLMEEEG